MRNCENCKYEDLDIAEDPCANCDNHDSWRPNIEDWDDIIQAAGYEAGYNKAKDEFQERIEKLENTKKAHYRGLVDLRVDVDDLIEYEKEIAELKKDIDHLMAVYNTQQRQYIELKTKVNQEERLSRGRRDNLSNEIEGFQEQINELKEHIESVDKNTLYHIAELKERIEKLEQYHINVEWIKKRIENLEEQIKPECLEGYWMPHITELRNKLNNIKLGNTAKILNQNKIVADYAELKEDIEKLKPFAGTTWDMVDGHRIEIKELKEQIEQMKIHIIDPNPKVNRLLINELKEQVFNDEGLGIIGLLEGYFEKELTELKDTINLNYKVCGELDNKRKQELSELNGINAMTKQSLALFRKEIKELKESDVQFDRLLAKYISKIINIEGVLGEFITRFVYDYNSGFNSHARAQHYLELIDKLDGDSRNCYNCGNKKYGTNVGAPCDNCTNLSRWKKLDGDSNIKTTWEEQFEHDFGKTIHEDINDGDSCDGCIYKNVNSECVTGLIDCNNFDKYISDSWLCPNCNAELQMVNNEVFCECGYKEDGDICICKRDGVSSWEECPIHPNQPINDGDTSNIYRPDLYKNPKAVVGGNGFLKVVETESLPSEQDITCYNCGWGSNCYDEAGECVGMDKWKPKEKESTHSSINCTGHDVDKFYPPDKDFIEYFERLIPEGKFLMEKTDLKRLKEHIKNKMYMGAMDIIKKYLAEEKE